MPNNEAIETTSQWLRVAPATAELILQLTAAGAHREAICLAASAGRFHDMLDLMSAQNTKLNEPASKAFGEMLQDYDQSNEAAGYVARLAEAMGSTAEETV